MGHQALGQLAQVSDIRAIMALLLKYIFKLTRMFESDRTVHLTQTKES